MKLIELFLKFSLVGVSGVIVNLMFYSISINFGVNYLLSAVIAFIFAVTNNFYWNFIWTFKNHAETKSVQKKYLEFFSVSFINFLVNISVLKFMVTLFDFNKIIAQIIAIGIAFIFNFIGNYLITFKEK